MTKEAIREHVRENIREKGRNYSHVSFKCLYNGVDYCSTTIYPHTAVNLLTNKIYFHTVVKKQSNENHPQKS